jgi:endonuclease YncB( thermonuclease family)
MARPSMFDNFPDELRCDYGPYMGVLDAWHDGDTCKVVFDPGFDQEPCRWIRLDGVNAPELSTEEGKAMLTWVLEQFPAPLAVKCVASKMARTGGQVMSFDRYVGTLYAVRREGLPGEIININASINNELIRRAS